MLNNAEESQGARQFWDAAAASFDDEPDHGLRDPLIAGAWREHLEQWLPSTPKRVLDIGCGTGSLSVLMAGLGHQVTGIDWSPSMVARAQVKAAAAGHDITLHVMDAAHPAFPAHSFDVILSRHLLWALPEPAQVLQRWLNLLAPGGRMILIEGRWHTGAGMSAQEVVNALPSSMSDALVQPLSDHAQLWGGEVKDERFVVLAHSQEG